MAGPNLSDLLWPDASMGRQPQGGQWKVAPEWKDRIVAAVLPSCDQEIISGIPSTRSGVTLGYNSLGPAYISPNNTSGAWFSLPIGHPLYQSLAQFGFLWVGSISAYASYGAIWSVDYTSGHPDPFNTLAFIADGATTGARFETSGSSATQYGGRISTTGFLTTDGKVHVYAASATDGGATAYKWWRDGTPFSDSSSMGNYLPTFTNHRPLTLFAHDPSTLTAGTTGACNLLVIFRYAPSDADIRALTANPWQILVPANDSIWIPAAAVAPPTAAFAATGGTGTLSASAWTPSSAAVGATGGTGTLAATASSPAVATVAITDASGTLSSSAWSSAVATLGIPSSSGVLSASAGSGTSAALAATGGSAIIVSSAWSSAVVASALSGGSGALSASASVSGGAGTGATAAEIWGYVMSNGYTAEENVVAIRAALDALTPAAISDYLLHNAVV